MSNGSLPDHNPTIAQEFINFWEAWQQGSQGREVGLRLLFTAWYGLIEPPHLTGFANDSTTSELLQKVFTEVHETMVPSGMSDPEFLYVVGLMASLSPWLLGDPDSWEERSAKYRQIYRGLEPGGIDPRIFTGRGSYGEYFEGQAKVKGGY